MKRLLAVPLFAISGVLFFTACFKNDTPRCTDNSLTQDKHIIDSFLDKNPSLDYITFNSTYNVYMGVENPGGGSAPAADSQIVFKRETRLLNGTLIDSGTVSMTQAGWPLKLSDFTTTSADYAIFTQLKKGGSMKVIVPSSLNGLGCQQGNGRYGTVPGNSQLINTITLVDVKRNQ